MAEDVIPIYSELILRRDKFIESLDVTTEDLQSWIGSLSSKELIIPVRVRDEITSEVEAKIAQLSGKQVVIPVVYSGAGSAGVGGGGLAAYETAGAFASTQSPVDQQKFNAQRTADAEAAKEDAAMANQRAFMETVEPNARKTIESEEAEADRVGDDAEKETSGGRGGSLSKRLVAILALRAGEEILLAGRQGNITDVLDAGDIKAQAGDQIKQWQQQWSKIPIAGELGQLIQDPTGQQEAHVEAIERQAAAQDQYGQSLLRYQEQIKSENFRAETTAIPQEEKERADLAEKYRVLGENNVKQLYAPGGPIEGLRNENQANIAAIRSLKPIFPDSEGPNELEKAARKFYPMQNEFGTNLNNDGSVASTEDQEQKLIDEENKRSQALERSLASKRGLDAGGLTSEQVFAQQREQAELDQRISEAERKTPAQTEIANLRASGSNEEAQKREFQKNLKKQIDEARTDLEAQKTTQAEAGTAATPQMQKNVDAAQQHLNQVTGFANAKMAEYDAGVKKTTDSIKEQTKELELRNSGDERAAELAKLRYEYEQKIKEAKGDPERQAALIAQERAQERSIGDGAHFSSPLSSWKHAQVTGVGDLASMRGHADKHAAELEAWRKTHVNLPGNRVSPNQVDHGATVDGRYFSSKKEAAQWQYGSDYRESHDALHKQMQADDQRAYGNKYHEALQSQPAPHHATQGSIEVNGQQWHRGDGDPMGQAGAAILRAAETIEKVFGGASKIGVIGMTH